MATRGEVHLPQVVFLFTMDQIAAMLNIEESSVRQRYIYWIGRTPGIKQRHQMEAVNIAPTGERADWRVSAKEFTNWLKRMGFKVYGLSYFS